MTSSLLPAANVSGPQCGQLMIRGLGNVRVPASLSYLVCVWGGGVAPGLALPLAVSPYLSIRVISMGDYGRMLLRRRCWAKHRVESREGGREEGSVRWVRAFLGQELL